MTNTERQFGDISQAFEFDQDSMDYIDGPVSGWLRDRRTDEWFAFDCQPVIADLLWHWNASFQYDAVGRRTSKTIWSEPQN